MRTISVSSSSCGGCWGATRQPATAVHEILEHLTAGSRVLDLGSGGGSFDGTGRSFRVVRLDLDMPPAGTARFVRADGARLPFDDGVFDAVVANHSLEHVERLDDCLHEIGRVLRPSGSAFVSVPDSTTFSDRIYRWLARGGGHVNAFGDLDALQRRLETGTGLKVAAVRPLLASLSFLHRRNQRSRIPRKALLFGNGCAPALHAINGLLRSLDRLAGTRTSLYGWALYLGALSEEVSTAPWVNVCIRCGSGHSPGSLGPRHRVERRWWIVRCYTCPVCGSWNVYYSDEGLEHLR